MARLACETKMGFYPTDTGSISKILNKVVEFDSEKQTYALDPCAGQGEAIEFIGNEYNCKSFAVELNKNRAIDASKKEIDHVLNADALNGVRKSNGWAGVSFLNPPYDKDSEGKRFELLFVQRWGLATTVGGLLMLVINPSSADEEMAKALQLQGYKPIASFYDPQNEDYQAFGQFFCLFQKQLPKFRASIDSFMSIFECPVSIDDDFEFEKIKVKTGREPEVFKEINTPRWKIDQQLRKSRLRSNFFQKSSSLMRASIEHPNEGQAAILIASGALNKEIRLANGELVILKGTSTKTTSESARTDEEGRVNSVRVAESYKTVIYGLSLSRGQFIKYQ